MRLERKYLGLVSNPEILIKKSRSRLELRDLEDKILVLVSNLESERDKILKSEYSFKYCQIPLSEFFKGF